MCTVTAAISGGLSAAQGYAGWRRQQAQYSANKAAINAENQAKRNAYNRSIQQRDREWARTLKVWDQELKQYEQTIKYNYDAAYGMGGAYQGLQVRTNEAFDQAAFENQDSLASLYQVLGSAQATGQTGVTADRFDTASLAAFGREYASRVNNLTRSREQQILDGFNVRRQLEAANNQAYSRVAVAPEPGLDPVAPTMRAAPMAPSPFGAIVGTAQGLFDAGQAGGLFGVGAQNRRLKINQNVGGAFGGSFNAYTPQAYGSPSLLGN